MRRHGGISVVLLVYSGDAVGDFPPEDWKSWRMIYTPAPLHMAVGADFACVGCEFYLVRVST